MPLRDHFRPPLDNKRSWDELHGAWPTVIVMALNKRLPPRYVAGPRVHLGTTFEIEVASYEEEATPLASGEAPRMAAWRPRSGRHPNPHSLSPPTCRTRTSTRCASTTPSTIAAWSPPSRSSARRTKIARRTAGSSSASVPPCSGSRFPSRLSMWSRRGQFNLFGDLLEWAGQSDPSTTPEPSPIYASACRWRRVGNIARLETWVHALALGQPLPTLPLWLADNLAVPLELEASYEETCRILRIS